MALPRILIADDDQALTQAIALRCRALGCQVDTFADGLSVYSEVTRGDADLLILDLDMPGASGLRLAEELSRDERFADIPIILLTGSSSSETIDACQRLGLEYVWKGLETWELLAPLILRLLDLPEPPATRTPEPVAEVVPEPQTEPAGDPPCVLVVDDDQDLARALALRFEQRGVRTLRAYSGMAGYWMAVKERPDLVILDYRMPAGDGNYLLGRLRENSLTREMPVIVLTGQRIDGRAHFGLERELRRLGANGYLTKPVEFEEIWAEVTRHVAVRCES